MSNKKGFTLLEILVAIMILSALFCIVSGIVLQYLKNGRERYDDKLEDSFLLAGKYYFTDNKSKLPKNGESVIVSLAELKSLNLVSKDFIDSFGTECSNEDSLVMVTNKKGKYEYKACLYCKDNDRFSEAHLETCDPVNNRVQVPDNPPGFPDDEDIPEKTICKIEKVNDGYMVYDDEGESKKVNSGVAAIKVLKDTTCDMNRFKCKVNEYKLDDESKISYYYGSDNEIYLTESAAQSNGVCQKTCVSYKLENGYDDGIGNTYKKSVSTISTITKNSELSTLFDNSINKVEDGKTYYLHYVKANAYNDILTKDSSSSSSTSATNGSTSTLSEYFNPSKKIKVVDSTNAKVHHNEAIPDEYEFMLSKSSTDSKVTIPSNLKMSQAQINKWGKDFSDYAQYGRVVLAEEGAKGNYKARYSNVGSYKGQKIDVLMTLTGFSGCKLKSGASKCGIWFEPKVLHIYSLGVKRISVKYEFFKAGTNTPIMVKGYSTYWDIDANQGIHFIKGTTGIYAYGSNQLYVSSLESAPYIFEYNDKKYSGYDQRGSVTETFSGSVLKKAFTFMSGNDGDHSKVTSSSGAIEPSTVPIGVSKEYMGSVDSETVLKKGQTIKFRIRYSNMSSSLQTLTITDSLTGMTYVKGSAKFSDGTSVNPTIKDGKLTWTKKVSALSSGYITYEVKVDSCGDLTKSFANLKVGSTTFKSRTLKNIVMCTKQVDTTCAEWKTT